MLLYVDKHGGRGHTLSEDLVSLPWHSHHRDVWEEAGFWGTFTFFPLWVCLKEVGKRSHIGSFSPPFSFIFYVVTNLCACLVFYKQELKIHLGDFTFGLTAEKKASKLHPVGQGSHPPPPKITNPNVTCLCEFSQKANLMLHSQCPWISATPK